MNEQIKPLAGSAGIHQPDRFDANDGSNQLERFAELVAEACAKAAEDQTRVARECLAGFGDNAVSHCQVAFVIRSGEWKKHMKGNSNV